MAKTKTSSLTDSASPPVPTVCIYQNSDYVADILQQMGDLGLATASEHEETNRQDVTVDTAASGGAGIAGGLSLPGVGKTEVNLKGDLDRKHGEGSSNDQRVKRQYVYSQAYYLQVVRRYLRERGLCRSLDSMPSQLHPGEFVEFAATFRGNEIVAILDIASPDLVSSLVEYRIRAEGLNIYDAGLTFEQRQAAAEKVYAKADNRSRLARAITEAVRTDFRSDDTREYYGAVLPVSEELTAVTICDTKHFLVDDEDRILDGDFTVLAKVFSGIEQDVSLFDRNKLLHRFNIDIIDELFNQLVEIGKASSKDNLFTKKIDSDILDVSFSAKLRGSSFKVMPIAIYV